jgi:hypothetical protein
MTDIRFTFNEAKHNDRGENVWLDADFENECVLLFVKAVKNYFDEYKEMPKDMAIISLIEELTLYAPKIKA